MRTVLSISSPEKEMITDDAADAQQRDHHLHHHHHASVAVDSKQEIDFEDGPMQQQQQQQEQRPNSNNNDSLQQQQQQQQHDHHGRIRQRGRKNRIVIKRPRPRQQEIAAHHHHHHYSLVELEKHVMVGLTIAGVASSLLTTTFGVFHVDLFLQAYHLPLASYSFGSFVFSMINTANDLLGAWIVDHVATRRKRTDLVALSGILFAVCFLTPFFRWQQVGHDDADANDMNNNNAAKQNTVWDLSHFVLSLSAYDTLYSFTAILLGSVVTDNHHLSDRERQAVRIHIMSFVVCCYCTALYCTAHSLRCFCLVFLPVSIWVSLAHSLAQLCCCCYLLNDAQFMASGKVANLFASFTVTRIGLYLFDTADLTQFRWFLLCLVTIVIIMFVVGQAMIHGYSFSCSGATTLVSTTFGLNSFRQQLGQICNQLQSRLRRLVLQWKKKNAPRMAAPVGSTDLEKASTMATTTMPTNPAVTDDLSDQNSNDGSNLHTDKKSDTTKSATNTTTTTTMTGSNDSKQLRFGRVVQDFWSHKNFRAWIGMEMLLEGT